MGGGGSLEGGGSFRLINTLMVVQRRGSFGRVLAAWWALETVGMGARHVG